MATFTYPSNAILQEIAQDLLPVLTMQDPIFEIMPITESDADMVLWEQEDNYVDLMKFRGINGQPNKVQPAGLKRWAMQPGYYGSFNVVDEQELTRRRQIGNPLAPINLEDIVMKRQNQLMTQMVNRIRTIGWTLVSTGTFSVTNDAGNVVHTDTFNVQTVTGSTWGTTATATPLADFRAVQLKQRGHSVRFDQSAKAYMNRVTFNYLTKNTNSADLYGKRTAGLQTVLGVNDINSVLLAEGLPQIVIHDDGYLDSTGTFVPFIADNKVAVVGNRTDNGKPAAFHFTRNANREDLGPGMYMYVTDSLANQNPIPREIQLHLGFNGGPALLFPSAFVVLTVS